MSYHNIFRNPWPHHSIFVPNLIFASNKTVTE